MDYKDDPFLNTKSRIVDARPDSLVPPEPGVFESIGAGISKAQEWTSLSYLEDLGILNRASKESVQDLINITDWNNTHPYFVEDVEWSSDLTLEMAKNIFSQRKSDLNYDNFVQRDGSYSGMFARGLGMLGGAVWDPVNLIPIPAGVYAKATILGSRLLGKMAVAGATNFGLETVVSGVGYASQRARAQDFGINDFATNLGFAVAVGAAFPLLGRGITGARDLYRGARAQRTNVDQSKSIVELAEEAAKKTDNELQTKIKFSTGQAPSSKLQTIKTFDFNTMDKVNIDTSGRIIDTGTVTVTRINDKVIEVSGNGTDIVKILPTLSTRVDGYETVVVKAGNQDFRIPTKELQQQAEEFAKRSNIDPKLDEIEFGFEKANFQNKNYEIEFDPTTNQATGRVFEITPTGKRRKNPLPDDQAEAIINNHRANSQVEKTRLNEKLNTQTVTQQATNRAGRQTVDVTQTKQNYKKTNQIEASVANRSREFVDNFGSSENAMRAITAEQVLPQKQLFSAGYFLDEQNNLIDLTSTRLSDLTSAQRDKIARALKIRRTEIPVDERGFVKIQDQELRTMMDTFNQQNVVRQTHKQSIIDYIDCTKKAGVR